MRIIDHRESILALTLEKQREIYLVSYKRCCRLSSAKRQRARGGEEEETDWSVSVHPTVRFFPFSTAFVRSLLHTPV